MERLDTNIVGIMLAVFTFLNNGDGVETQAASTCYHCYWYDEYNGGNDDVLPGGFEPADFDARGVEGVYTVNCKDNLDLVPTIQCDKDCVTLEFVSPPWHRSNGGFVNYISRTCAVVPGNVAGPTSVSVEHTVLPADARKSVDAELESCSTETKNFFDLLLDVTTCSCSGDMCNNKPLQNINFTTCYSCHYGTHSGPVEGDLQYDDLLTERPGLWTSKCETPDSSLKSTVECPYDCYFYSYKFEAFVNEYENESESVDVIGRGCWYDYKNKQFEIQPESCVDVLNSSSISLPLDDRMSEWAYCRCSQELCKIGGDSSGANKISSSILLALPLMILNFKSII